eukprot:13584887-Heterocapsa_arctica.AAC.1
MDMLRCVFTRRSGTCATRCTSSGSWHWSQAYARGFNIYLWIALPCTPWSSWQHINAAVNDAT